MTSAEGRHVFPWLRFLRMAEMLPPLQPMDGVLQPQMQRQTVRQVLLLQTHERLLRLLQALLLPLPIAHCASLLNVPGVEREGGCWQADERK